MTEHKRALRELVEAVQDAPGPDSWKRLHEAVEAAQALLVTTPTHTPGPWRWNGFGQIHGATHQVANVFYLDGSPEGTANVYLIAAAPMLLVAAQSGDADALRDAITLATKGTL